MLSRVGGRHPCWPCPRGACPRPHGCACARRPSRALPTASACPPLSRRLPSPPAPPPPRCWALPLQPRWPQPPPAAACCPGCGLALLCGKHPFSNLVRSPQHSCTCVCGARTIQITVILHASNLALLLTSLRRLHEGVMCRRAID